MDNVPLLQKSHAASNGASPAPQSYYTTSSGCPIFNPQASQRIGNNLKGTMLLQDINLLETINAFTHERTPERVVHAKGAGAYGTFEVTADMTDVTSADFLSAVGKKTDLLTRFSTIVGERGSADTVRDSRGMAFKLKTDEGNLDWVFLNEPVFPIRDGGKLPSLVHANKRNPATNLKDSTMFWDYFTNNPEGVHHLMYLFSDAATPISYANLSIFSANLYKFTKTDGSYVYVKLTLKPDQGVKNFTGPEALKWTGEDPDYYTRDLYARIAASNFPSWTVGAQILTPAEAETCPINPFDVTKTLPDSIPIRWFGKITLNANPQDYFTEVEQAAFNPTSIVPGWAPSPDPVLQTRLLAYASTQRHRLGTNFMQLPANTPLSPTNLPLQREGAANLSPRSYGSIPPYLPTSLLPSVTASAQYVQPDHEKWVGEVVDFASVTDESDWVQPREMWEAWTEGEKEAWISNTAGSVRGALESVREATYAMFTKVSPDLATRLKNAAEQSTAKGHALQGNDMSKSVHGRWGNGLLYK